jgi:hypothetical protein
MYEKIIVNLETGSDNSSNDTVSTSYGYMNEAYPLNISNDCGRRTMHPYMVKGLSNCNILFCLFHNYTTRIVYTTLVYL